MTIAKDGSEQSGWVHDPVSLSSFGTNGGVGQDGLVWRCGTERPCKLKGRYVTIYANYSAIQTPFEIALCHWGIMGSRVPVSDEVIDLEEPIPEPIPPTFANDLQPSPVVLNIASSWVIPEVIIGSAALVDVVVIPDLFLTNVIDYDARSKTISFAGSASDSELKTGYFKLKITLIDVNGLEKEYT